MDFPALDPTLYRWADRHGLHVFTRYRDEEIRSTMVVDDAGDTYTISLFPADAQKVTIIAALRERHGRCVSRAERERYRLRLEGTGREVEAGLEQAYMQVMAWIKEAGHERTPI